MSKVTFIHRGGREQVMHEKFAKVLQRLGRGTYADVEPAPVEEEVELVEIKASKAARDLAESAGVDLGKVIGTGNDGAITKPDVEAFIAAQNPQE